MKMSRFFLSTLCVVALAGCGANEKKEEKPAKKVEAPQTESTSDYASDPAIKIYESRIFRANLEIDSYNREVKALQNDLRNEQTEEGKEKARKWLEGWRSKRVAPIAARKAAEDAIIARVTSMTHAAARPQPSGKSPKGGGK